MGVREVALPKRMPRGSCRQRDSMSEGGRYLLPRRGELPVSRLALVARSVRRPGG